MTQANSDEPTAGNVDTVYVEDEAYVMAAAVLYSRIPPEWVNGLPVLIRVGLRAKRVDANGMPEGEEAPILLRISESAYDHLKSRHARFVGRLTTKGVRHFFYYAPDASDCVAGAREALRQFPDYVTEVEAKVDRAWAFYRHNIQPLGEYDRQKTLTVKLLKNLRDQGDDSGAWRPIDHQVHFTTMANAEAFASWARSRGFSIRGMRETPGGELAKVYPVMVELQRVEKPVFCSMLQTLHEVVCFSADWGGFYSGNGCMLVRKTIA